MKVFVRTLLACALLLILMGSFSGISFAHMRSENLTFKNTSNNIERTNRKVCPHQMVQLHGSLLPTITCLSQQTTQEISPNIGAVGCNQAQVELIASDVDNYDTVCIEGDGFINLNSLLMPCTPSSYWTCGTPWDGEALYYNLYGCATNFGQAGNNDYPGYFASAYNGNGVRIYFKNIANSGSFNFSGHGVLVGPFSLLINC
jgi:hypothetical protein